MQSSLASCNFPPLRPNKKTADKEEIKCKFMNEMNRIHGGKKPTVAQFKVGNSIFYAIPRSQESNIRQMGATKLKETK
jgi:hypothetical protein